LDKNQYILVISSGNIDSRTSLSSACSSLPIAGVDIQEFSSGSFSHARSLIIRDWFSAKLSMVEKKSFDKKFYPPNSNN
jgi:hypothetical protein